MQSIRNNNLINPIDWHSQHRQYINLGAHDCKIYIYDVKVSEEGAAGVVSVVSKLRATFSKHNRWVNRREIACYDVLVLVWLCDGMMI